MDVPYCSINELYGILKDKTLKLSKMTNPQMDKIFQKTLQYCERFNKINFESVEKNSQRSQEIRRYDKKFQKTLFSQSDFIL